MRLIDYEALEKDAAPKTWELITEGKYFKAYGYLVDALNDAPTVDAVPLDKLCEWLNVHCGRPNYCNDRLCGECNLDDEGFEYEPCWKTLLTEWMEEQDAAD